MDTLPACLAPSHLIASPSHRTAGDAQTIEKMLATGGTLLGNSMDENRRAAMHFTAATNNLKCTELLVQCGAEVDIADKGAGCGQLRRVPRTAPWQPTCPLPRPRRRLHAPTHGGGLSPRRHGQAAASVRRRPGAAGRQGPVAP